MSTRFCPVRRGTDREPFVSITDGPAVLSFSKPEAALQLLEDDRWVVVIGSFSEVDCGVAVARRSVGADGGAVLTVPWVQGVDREFRRCGVAEAMVSRAWRRSSRLTVVAPSTSSQRLAIGRPSRTSKRPAYEPGRS